MLVCVCLLVVVVVAVGGGATSSSSSYSSSPSSSWNDVTRVLEEAIALRSFPGCVAGVVSKDSFLYLQPLGNFTYGIPPPQTPTQNPPTTARTLFDLASLTKVLATTTATMTFYQRGELSLSELVMSDRLLGPDYGTNGKETITVRNLMLHNSGYPPDPYPGYWSSEFGCPATPQPYPPEVFTCSKKIFQSLLNQTLINPVGEKYVYSDLSMITMMYVVGTLARRLSYISMEDLNKDCKAAFVNSTTFSNEDTTTALPIDQCYYEAYVRKYVVEQVGMTSSGFLPDPSQWGNTMPTWNDTTGSSPGPPYREGVIQGQVSDQNSYALGGIAGHAGFFSNILDVAKLTSKLLFASDDDDWVNKTTVSYFTKVHNVTQSSRAYGWDTNNYFANTYRGCGKLSSTTFTHTGYTGTQVCNDPEREVTTILLTNRVYPKADDESEDKIHLARQAFNDKVKDVLDSFQ
eukprot:m.5641 g.5641  ORF g.5641 m.5641 type:complete len:461 (-) comp4491_c0_seq1:702-2084(-)